MSTDDRDGAIRDTTRVLTAVPKAEDYLGCIEDLWARIHPALAFCIDGLDKVSPY